MDAATIVRSARAREGISQRALARVARVPQPNLSEIESGSADVTVDRLNRILGAVGEQVVVLPTTAPTVTEAASSIGAHLTAGDEGGARIELVRFADRLAGVAADVRVALCVSRPPTTGDLRFDAALAATIEYLLADRGLPVPSWARAAPAAPERLYLVPNPAIRRQVEAETPEPFRRRNVFVPADFFASV
jgi:transcriptional regulator with XRE-family HTH domain